MGMVAGYTARGAPILTVHPDAVVVAVYGANTLSFGGIGAALGATADGVENAGKGAVESISQGTVTGVPAEIVGM